jgi:flagellum-specific ATP synthase
VLKPGIFDFQLKENLRGLDYVNLYKESGRVRKIVGPIIEGTLPGASVGGICHIHHPQKQRIEAEIIGFKDRVALLMPTDSTQGITMGARIELAKGTASTTVGPWMLGKLLDGHGRLAPESKLVDSPRNETRVIQREALGPMDRRNITQRFVTGVRSIDATSPIGLGQRLAIMAASGVGKSVLMGMIARNSSADVNVIALIGERGREVSEFIEHDLGPEGMKKSVVVAVTSDQSPVLRVRGAYVATTIAEYFRDQGLNVLLMMDSVTRFGMALREIGLASGEPPTTKGYTPSVFNQLPRLLERAGAKKNSGTITGLYTVLVESNDFDDPLADAVKSILDGHVVLSRELAARNFYPAIDVLHSISRLTKQLLNEREVGINARIRETLEIYKSMEDLINIGGYRKGNNPEVDRAIDMHPKLIAILKQRMEEETTLEKTLSTFEGVLGG